MAFSSSASSKTPTSAARNHYEPRSGGGGGGVDSCYFPGCRKDANCHCEICVESFNATRDLHSALRFPHVKKGGVGVKNPSPPSSSDDPRAAPPLTPEPVSSVSTVPRPPRLMRSTAARSRAPKGKATREVKEEGPGGSLVGYKLLAVLVGIWGFLVLDLGVLEVLFLDGFGPKLGMEMARGFGEEARVTEGGLKGRLRVVEGKVKGAVGGGEEERVANCSSSDSVWKLNQGGHHHLSFQWRCVIYQSMAEELSVWGSPLQTSGILAAGVSARSLTLLSGRIIEWSGGGKLVPTSRSSNGSSWTLDRWSSTAVQLEGETWVLEYQRSALFQGSGLIQSAWEISRLRTQRMARGLRWRLALARTTFGGGGGSSSSYYRASEGIQPHFKQPT